ncbi:hypothetical protein AN218_12550, partial [Streptomyces nanshensis]
MLAAILDRPLLSAEFGAARLLVAEEHQGPVVALAHALPPVEWLMSMDDQLGRELCALLSRSLVELEAVAVAPGARGRGLG